MRAPILASVGSAILAFGLVGCSTTTTVGYPAEYVSMKSPGHVSVTQADKSVVELYNPQIHGDTLVGFVGKSGTYAEIPLNNVQLMRAREVSMGRTMVIAGVGAIGAALLLTRITGTNGGANVCFPPGGDNRGLPVPCTTPGATTGGP